MASRDGLQQHLRGLRHLPADQVLVTAWVLSTVVVVRPPASTGPLRLLLGLPFVFILPGYSLLSAVFPRHPDAATARTLSPLPWFDRLVLAGGLSVTIVPLVGLVLHFTAWGVRPVPVLYALALLTLVLTLLGTVQRLRLPRAERLTLSIRPRIARAINRLLAADGRTRLLSVLLAVALVISVAGLAYGVARPKPGATYSEFYLLTEANGTPVADGYPETIPRFQEQSIVLGITNHEGRPVTYTVVVQFQRVDPGPPASVERVQPVDRFQVSLGPTETWRQPQRVAPQLTGDTVRLVFLLYLDEIEGQPSIETAYREVHLPINVTGRTAASSV